MLNIYPQLLVAGYKLNGLSLTLFGFFCKTFQLILKPSSVMKASSLLHAIWKRKHTERLAHDQKRTFENTLTLVQCIYMLPGFWCDRSQHLDPQSILVAGGCLNFWSSSYCCCQLLLDDNCWIYYLFRCHVEGNLNSATLTKLGKYTCVLNGSL